VSHQHTEAKRGRRWFLLIAARTGPVRPTERSPTLYTWRPGRAITRRLYETARLDPDNCAAVESHRPAAGLNPGFSAQNPPRFQLPTEENRFMDCGHFDASRPHGIIIGQPDLAQACARSSSTTLLRAGRRAADVELALRRRPAEPPSPSLLRRSWPLAGGRS
jgi:hypothetical protein